MPDLHLGLTYLRFRIYILVSVIRIHLKHKHIHTLTKGLRIIVNETEGCYKYMTGVMIALGTLPSAAYDLEAQFSKCQIKSIK